MEPKRGVCPWCKRSEVDAEKWNGHIGCWQCLSVLEILAERCRCGTVIRPHETDWYEADKFGNLTCCHCLGSVRCQVSSCMGCYVCCPDL